jgi:hypothetical protein
MGRKTRNHSSDSDCCSDSSSSNCGNTRRHHSRKCYSSDDSSCSDRQVRCIKKFYKTINNSTGTVNNNTLIAYSDFYGMMPGDNATVVGAGTGVQFPEDGPTNGLITRLDASTFSLRNVGVYEVQFQVSVSEPGQLVIALDNGTGFMEVANSVVGRTTGACQIVGISLIQTTVPNTLLSIFNPSGNAPALTITPFAGGTHAVSCHLVIKQIA